MTSSILKEAIVLQQPGVAILSFEGCAYILYGKNMWNSIHNLTQSIDMKGYDERLIAAYKAQQLSLSFIPLDTQDEYMLRLYASLEHDRLERAAIVVLSKKAVKPTVSLDVVYHGIGYLVRVVVCFPRYRIVVGAFRVMKEAQQFITEHYPDNKVEAVVVAINNDTRKVLRKK